MIGIFSRFRKIGRIFSVRLIESKLQEANIPAIIKAAPIKYAIFSSCINLEFNINTYHISTRLRIVTYINTGYPRFFVIEGSTILRIHPFITGKSK